MFYHARPAAPAVILRQASLRGRVFGRHGSLVVPGGRQFFQSLGLLRGGHLGLLAVWRQIMNRKVGAGFLRACGGIGRGAHNRHIRNRCRAAAKRQRRQQQQSDRKGAYFSIHRHWSGSPHFANPKLCNLIIISSVASAGFNLCRSKRLSPEQEIEPLGLEYDRSRILCRSATGCDVRVNPEPFMVDQRGDEP
jgi:hypothetical protein